MKLLASTTDRFGGIIVDSSTLPENPDGFAEQLQHSFDIWREQGSKLVWIEVPLAKSNLIPIAVEAGSIFHHSTHDHLMLAHRLVSDAYVPSYATHYIGAGGVVINERQELLVVSELHRRDKSRPYYKLPGGALNQKEHLADAVMREVYEETGVETKFEAVVCFRHWHNYRFGKSDIYFICRLSPLSDAITRQDNEIDECLWMPVDEYLNSEYVGEFNRRIVELALNHKGLKSGWFEGYDDPTLREFFVPADKTT